MLYIVGTPIGNLEDISLRAIRILKEVDFIACEDTRHTKILLEKYGISTPRISYWKEDPRSQERIINLLKDKNIALVSEAGMPAISDPGSLLIKRAINENIKIEVIPGPTALITALLKSGLDTSRFIFCGFLPRQKGKIKKELEKLKKIGYTLIIYESPYRIKDTLDIVADIFGQTDIVVARELTKKFEEVIRGKTNEVIEKLSPRKIKGEVVLLISPPKNSPTSPTLAENNPFCFKNE